MKKTKQICWERIMMRLIINYNGLISSILEYTSQRRGQGTQSGFCDEIFLENVKISSDWAIFTSNFPISQLIRVRRADRNSFVEDQTGREEGISNLGDI